jgi:hypothetical protein
MFSPDDLLGGGLMTKAAAVIGALRAMPKKVIEATSKRSARNLFAPTIGVPAFKSRSRVVDMPIDYFSQMADKLSVPDAEKMTAIRDVLNAGNKLETLPLLYIDDVLGGTSKVTGHEGRHRALALKERGYTHMPVEVRGDIRWDQQIDPKRFDYVKEWPQQLMGQQGISSAYPIPRELSIAEYPEVVVDMLRKKP